MTASTRVRPPVFARLYSRVVVPAMTKKGAVDLRRRTLAGLAGTVVEVGAGDGANFALYPDEVERIVAVEPEPFLRERASGHADERVELRDALAEKLPVGDGEADAVVFTLVLCSVDQGAEWFKNLYGSEEKWNRLRKLKAQWDPQNLFRHNQNIRPAAIAAE